MFYKCQRRIILNWILYTVTNEQTVTNCDKLVILCLVFRITAQVMQHNPVLVTKGQFPLTSKQFPVTKHNFKVYFEFRIWLHNYTTFRCFWLVENTVHLSDKFFVLLLMLVACYLIFRIFSVSDMEWNQIVFLSPNSAIRDFWYFVASQSIPTNHLQ